MPGSRKRALTAADRPRRPPGLCSLCGKPVKPPRRTWCGQPCIDLWNFLSSVSAQVDAVWERDSGRCQLCGRDVQATGVALWALKTALGPRSQEWVGTAAALGLALEPCGFGAVWNVHHIRPVAKGGGVRLGMTRDEVLGNQVLACIWCHRAVHRGNLVVTGTATRLRVASPRNPPPSEKTRISPLTDHPITG